MDVSCGSTTCPAVFGDSSTRRGSRREGHGTLRCGEATVFPLLLGLPRLPRRRQRRKRAIPEYFAAEFRRGDVQVRSEERRVGKECRSGRGRWHLKKNSQAASGRERIWVITMM